MINSPNRENTPFLLNREAHDFPTMRIHHTDMLNPNFTGMNHLGIQTIQRFTYMEGGKSIGVMNGFSLHTAIQPIFSLAHKRIVGYEALARVKNHLNHFMNPSDLFRYDQNEQLTVFLDRLCRYVHINNFKTIKDDINWLFLNVSPQTVINGKKYGSYFDDLLANTQFPPYRIVIEIVENPTFETESLSETVAYYKSIGCLIAIDDFGKGHSNFERIWLLNPEIVKLDRSMIVRASQQNNVRQLLPGIVSLLHQAGSLVLIEGIETEEQAMIAMDCDADFVQGYYFAKPSTELKTVSRQSSTLDLLFEKYKKNSTNDENKIKKIYDQFQSVFLETIDNIRKGDTLERACRSLLSNSRVIRCYLLQPNGIQIGHTVVSNQYQITADIRFRPLDDANSADWFRRHYLRRAIVHPDQMQITRPYLSITGAHMCMTLSMMFSVNSDFKVFCCDITTDE